MCTEFGPNWLRFAGLIPERVQKSQYNIGFQPTIIIIIIIDPPAFPLSIPMDNVDLYSA